MMESDKQTLELILQKLEVLELSHMNIERKIDEIHKNTKRMEDHINFVENTYDKIKTPFHFFMDKVNILSFLSFRKSGETYKIENSNQNDKSTDNSTVSNIVNDYENVD